MERDLTNIAKDMLQGQQTRLLSLRSGNWKTRIGVELGGIEDDNGLPTATINAFVQATTDTYRSFAQARLFYDVDRHVSKSPGKKAFAAIVFSPENRGFELARSFTQWVDDWVPLHQHALRVGKGDALAGARASRKPKDEFVRTPIVTDISKCGTGGTGTSLARLMLSPLTSKPSRLDDELELDCIYSLHRTVDGSPARTDELIRIEEQRLVGATVAWDKSGQSFTAFDAEFGVQLGDATSRGLLRALVEAILAASKNTPKMPTEFRSPTNYALVDARLGNQRTAWKELAGI